MADPNDQAPEAAPAPDQPEAETSTEESLEDTGSDRGSSQGGDAPEAGSEAPAGSEETPQTGSGGAVDDATTGASKAPAPKKSGRVSKLGRYVNVYTLIFVFVILLAGAIALIAYQQNRKSNPTDQIKTQGLSQSTLDQLAKSDVNVGSNNTVLNVKSSAIFAGQVLVRKGLEVAGDLKVGGNLQINGTVSLNNITVSGTSQLGDANVNKNLAVAGTTALQGSTTIAKNLQVGGSGTFKGEVSAPQVTTGNLQLNGNLTLAHHISTNGGQPGRSGGAALGGGGSASVSGSDVAGSISVNTGSGPAAGCFVTINFTARYDTTPHVLVTPVGSAAGSLDYYVNRSATGFSVCDATTPPAGKSFGFDYFVID